MFDERSERLLKTLTSRAEKQARVFLQKVRDADIDARIISATRTYAEQDALFAQGRTNPGTIVTNARGGFSNHNFAIAWDLGLFDDKGIYLDASPLYAQAGKIGRDMGLEWGGDWKTFKDAPHFQCQTGKTLAELREIVSENGGDITRAVSAIDAVVLPLPGEKVDKPSKTDKPTPADPKVPTPPTPVTPPTNPLVPVSVYLNKNPKPFDIAAFFDDSRVYVGVRDFADYFGGQLSPSPIPADAKTVTFGLNEKQAAMPLRWENKTAYVKFADLNAVLGYTFTFDSKARKLTLSR